jgi:hypothetical protein
VRIDAAPGRPLAVWAVWRRRGGEWRFEVHPPATTRLDFDVPDDLLVVRTVDALGHEGPAAMLRR